MTEEDTQLLAVFEDRMHELIRLCDARLLRLKELQATLEAKEEVIRQSKQDYEDLQAKYNTMLTARLITANVAEVAEARKRVSRLIEEVDKCMKLIKE
ncbi:MAG: hypothetical protein LBS80_02560 [Tannerella sp.]|jgi:septal ring factor EnvC (AmiA/AmiB activator)|nr:hypothetical protein [Tannerella sp.]